MATPGQAIGRIDSTDSQNPRTHPGKSLGKIPFDSPTGTYFRKNVQARWFAHFLKEDGKLDLPEALLFETGSNK